MADLPSLEEAHEIDKSMWSAEVLLFITILPLTLSLLVGISMYLIDADADLRYFGLAAQIIPVLVLALVIEQHYFFQGLPLSLPSSTVVPMAAQWERMVGKVYEYQAALFLVLIGGEVAALWAVASANPSRIAFAATTTGLVAGTIALMASSGKGLLASFGERQIARKMETIEEESGDKEKPE